MPRQCFVDSGSKFLGSPNVQHSFERGEGDGERGIQAQNITTAKGKQLSVHTHYEVPNTFEGFRPSRF